ncbi:cilia- and flagella-associated protein 119-like isoform X2 [Physella acuta]|uniref:cilia- and flagella-associated protein 119-like isoform X2 n=1 Tax=Physella acuta TaxID=109671 RepID=UPI0027DD6180|nr:cilia- and flagella-associated protein 119-like isoform X2 [Physella acuta]
MVPTEEEPTSEETVEKPVIAQPKLHKAKILVWSDLSVDAVDRLNESLNVDHIKQVLAEIFRLEGWKDNLKTGIIMDLYYYTLQFAREQGFSKEKQSTFFSIIKNIFEVCIETPFGNLDHTFQYFKDLLHCHAVNHPPYSIELFTPNEARKISEYTINTFFRHFKMYKYAFTAQVRLDLHISYQGMASPPPSEVSTALKEESQLLEDETLGELETEKIVEDNDEQLIAAKEEFKSIVRNFLTQEAKKIEGRVEDQIKAAVDTLNNKIDPMIGKPDAKVVKKK